MTVYFGPKCKSVLNQLMHQMEPHLSTIYEQVCVYLEVIFNVSNFWAICTHTSHYMVLYIARCIIFLLTNVFLASSFIWITRGVRLNMVSRVAVLNALLGKWIFEVYWSSLSSLLYTAPYAMIVMVTVVYNQ